MADLEEAKANDPDLAELEALVDGFLTPQLEQFEKDHVDPLAKIIGEVSIGTNGMQGKIQEIDSIFKSTRVMAEDLQANLVKEKIEIDQIIIDSKDAQVRTGENESQLFQSKISSSNPFNLFYLYQSLDRKSHTSTATTNTTVTTAATISSVASSSAKKASGNSCLSPAGGNVTVLNSNSNQTKSTSIPSNTNEEPEIIDLCGGSEDVVTYDAVYDQVPSTQAAEIARGMKLLAKKKGTEGGDAWFEATLLNIITDQGNKKFKVKFDTMGKRLLSGKHIALKTHPTFEQLKIGSRVVAVYRKVSDGDNVSTVLYSGIIAELPMITNRGRFLIFYDIGYAQYVDLDDLYLVYQSTAKVWEDDMGDMRDFIMRYLKRYPERPMVRLAVGQWAKTEWNGVWWRAKVKQVDGSLALMHFESDNRDEWIYRGSPRLEPLFSELQKAEEAQRVGNKLVASGTSNPYKRRRPTRVEYTIVMKQQLTTPRNRNVARKSTSVPRSPEVRKKKGQTALKSTSMSRDHHNKHHHHRKSPSPTPDIFELDDSEENSRAESIPASIGSEGPSSSSPSPMIINQPQTAPRTNLTVAELLSSVSSSVQVQQHVFTSHQKQAKRKKRKNQKSFVAHNCNYYCVINCWPSEQSKTFNKNPLRLPEICGWSRELAKMKGSGRRHVVYRTPCGRLLRGMDEINKYLMATCINYLSVDHFTFDPFVYTLTRKPRTKPIWKIDDISKGAEPMPVSCVNELDSSPLPSVEYVAHRLPSGGTEINTDPAFLTGCDCIDNCMDKSRCACWQMTIESTAVSASGVRDPDAGYVNRRLSEHLPTGVFECNSRCKCNTQCHNRVVQNGIKLRLQVFKTNKRGWGLRCLDDIPKGAFVCIYAGQIWKEEMANERGRLYGDEYFAELDYIEVVENNKEGYESDVASDDMSDRGYNSSDDESNGEGSDADYRGGSDSDADYVPRGFGSGGVGVGGGGGGGGNGSSQSDTGSVGELDNLRSRDLTQVSTRLTFRRQMSAEVGKRATDQQWSVVPSNKENQEKVENWVKHLPDTNATQEANNTTPTKASTPAGEPDTPTRLYGYNINPGNVLDSKALEAFRKRKEKEKAMRRRKLDSESPKTGNDNGVDNPITLSSSDEEDSRGSNNAKRNPSPVSKPTTPAPEPSNSTAQGGNSGGVEETAATSNSQSFGGFQIEGITSLAVESDDTDESDTDETKGAKDNGTAKKMTSVPKSTQHSRMSLSLKGTGPQSDSNIQQGDASRRAAPPMRTRPFFGEEHHYIMDAKFIGNLGRYLNHSCSPNLFVQNVFVDTHDLRFPWVAFFAHERIRASTELTWDYNYDVGSVPGKTLPCYCGSHVCKGRLL